MTNKQNLTDQTLWEDYWEDKPPGNKKKKTSLLVHEILDIFDKRLPQKQGLQVLEIGGGSGEYLLHLVKKFGYLAHSLDYSAKGNEQTVHSFSKARETVSVYERDLFASNQDLPRFDLVFSLGLIEHFENTDLVVQKHLELVKPGGILLLGVPNYAGIYEPVLKKLAPSITETHNLSVMDLSSWHSFEKKYKLETIFKQYIGGFEPLNMKKLEVKTPINRIIYFVIQVLMTILSFRFRFLRRFNSRWWSGYMVGIYKKPSAKNEVF